MIVAGEASGDIYGAHLVKAIKELDPSIEFFGLGGPKMKQIGVRILHHLSAVAVVGLTEIIPKSRYIFRVARELKQSLSANPPNLLILIDYPGFNLHLAKKAHSLGIPVFYYIPPQVWAWRRGRVKKIAKSVDRLAVILPFEKEFYQKHGLNAEYVGHPLLDVSSLTRNKQEIKDHLAINNRIPILGLLPGSRDKEIESLLPEMIGAAEILSHDYPHLYCILPLASTVKEDIVAPFVRNTKIDITIGRLDTKEVLKIVDLALIASGTATLEAAMMETPMVIAYKVSFLSYMIGRFIVKVSHIGLVNLVAGKTIVPELIQGRATALHLAEEASDILKNESLKKDMKEGLKLVHEQLGRGGAAKKAAHIAGEMMGL